MSDTLQTGLHYPIAIYPFLLVNVDRPCQGQVESTDVVCEAVTS